ncbi:hypothetical protein JZ751_022300 [Albula glossodonta]|uniref:DUF4200 domain-containing protein n=1 Tax=Albula glossodonta TaxID=121402 RepID=A0A8T2NIZ7_9TELE|nr:hypothetical protein JZ751_022300 [Albula glossodonta]
MELEEITRAEKHVEEEEIVFQKLIEEREEKLSNALQLSEKFAKLKTEVTEEYEKRTAEIRKLKSDIESFREKLREYTQYKDFLTGLAPATWREQQTQKKEQRRIAKLESLKNAGTDQSQKEKKKRKHSTKPKKPPQKQHKKGSKKSGQDTCPKVEFSDSDEEPEIYFTDPMDVMTALDELMEEDLFHIQDFQDTEEDMTRIHKVLQQTKTETTTLMQQGNENIETLKANIKTAEEIASDLELKSRLFSYGEYSVNQDKMIKSLHEKVKKVYEKCVDDVDTSTLSMLTSMEHKVEEIMQLIEELPPGMMLLEKQILERQMRMERQKRAAERAAADIKRITTRKLVYRSQPPKLKKKDSSRQLSMVTKEQLEAEYYFS